MDKSLPIQKFPLKEFKEELDRDHAEFEVSVQEALSKLREALLHEFYRGYPCRMLLFV